jgi:myo-inositol-1(or 4)-monophosphatase
MSDFLHVCEQAARAGAGILLDRRGKVEPIVKGPKDIVTEADLASQKAILKILSDTYPDHLMMAEEGGPNGAVGESYPCAPITPDQYRWIVDPLDGTINYVHGVPSFAVSVALEMGGELLVGVVYDPMLDECFAAARGDGAFLNGERICASKCESLENALMAVSFSANVPRGSVEIRRFVEILHSCHTVRRLGSAALNLCYVASGRLDCYIASAVKTWDVAAGALLLQEAGATITSLDGGPFELYRPQFACAATAQLHAELMEILARVE